MVKKAKIRGVDAQVMSAIDLSFEHKFGAIFSNAVLHWVKDSRQAIQNIKNVLKPKGRFIAEFGGYKNIKTIVDAIQEVFEQNSHYGKFVNPWYFPSDKQYKKDLEENGFEVKNITLTPRPTPIDDVSNWLKIFANGIVSHLSQQDQDTFILKTRKILEEKLYSKENGWVVDYVRIRVEAVCK